ncbi:hypothetical protein FBUS_10221 [Fasciolopsis buskii]|uniref:LisH domain-containing protein n=1 Tax=Fasciolopsis buskii TaxID=27845 RepID=A0A8E0VG33_9TREM|nr:hypothetical protein FBUS_10221 [Fasciolopsis buski]
MYQMLAASGELETLKSLPNESRLGNKYKSLASRLIISHLRVHRYEYTLSVFVPECGLSPAEVYCLGPGGNAQLLDPEKLLPEIELLKREPGYEVESQDYSPLELMLQYFEHRSAHPPVCAGIQTEEDLPFQFYDERLLNIDRVFETRRCVNLQSTKETVEQRMEQMRREMEIQFTEKLNCEANFYRIQVERFRTSKMVELKEQMDEKYHRMLQDSEKKLREDYERQIANLSEHHKQMQKQAELTRQADEREAFLRRQNMQTEVESLRARLAELKEEKEQLLRSVNCITE